MSISLEITFDTLTLISQYSPWVHIQYVYVYRIHNTPTFPIVQVIKNTFTKIAIKTNIQKVLMKNAQLTSGYYHSLYAS